MFLDLGSCCPRLDKYKTLFNQYDRVRDSISTFYATIVAFCQKAIVVMQRSGQCFFFSLRFDSKNLSFQCHTGIKHFRTAIWKPFKQEFQQIKTEIETQREEVDEEIKLAAQISADAERRGALFYRQEAKAFQDTALKELNQTRSSLNVALKGEKGNGAAKGLL
jgi:hypothetical protein